MVGGGRRWELTTATPDTGYFLQDFCVFSGVFPFLVPVESLAILPPPTLDCCFEDEFCNVLGRRAVNATICKVLDYGTAIVADRAKVKGISTTVEGQAVKTTISSSCDLCILFETYIISNSWISIDEG